MILTELRQLLNQGSLAQNNLGSGTSRSNSAVVSAKLSHKRCHETLPILFYVHHSQPETLSGSVTSLPQDLPFLSWCSGALRRPLDCRRGYWDLSVLPTKPGLKEICKKKTPKEDMVVFWLVLRVWKMWFLKLKILFMVTGTKLFLFFQMSEYCFEVVSR
jgi:hypothetical protein